MPKVKPSELEERRRVAKAMMLKAETLAGKSKREMATALHVSNTTYYSRLETPDEMRLSMLWRLVDKFHLSDEDILAIATGRLKS